MLGVRWTPFSLAECRHVDCCVEVQIEECEECGNSVGYLLSKEILLFH